MNLKLTVLALSCSLTLLCGCRSMRGSANEPVVGGLLEVNDSKPGLRKDSNDAEIKIEQDHCQAIEESMNPHESDKSIELGISKTIKDGSANPYAGYRCKPK